MYLSYVVFALNLAISFVLTPLMLSYLGRSLYGVWVIVSSFIAYIQVFDFGMNVAVAKYTAEYRATNQNEKLSRLISSVFVILLGFGCLAVLISVGFLPFVPRLFDVAEEFVTPVRVAFFIMGVNIPFAFVGGVFENITYGLQRVDIWRIFAAVRLLSYAFFTILLLALGLGIVGPAIASILSTLILFPLYLFFFRRVDYGIVLRPDLLDVKTLKEVAPYSIRSFVLGITSRILYQTDSIVIGIFLGAAKVTPYAIAYRLCFLATYFFSQISSVMFPTFSRLYALGDLSALRSLYLTITRISIAIMTPIAIFLLFFGHSFIVLWVGPENWVGFNVFLMFIIMDFIHAYGTPIGLLLQGIGRNRWFTYSEMSNAGLNLLLSVVLAPRLGVPGVMLGTLVAVSLTGAWFGPLLACRYLELPVRRYILSGILPPLLVGIPAGAFTWIFAGDLFGESSYFQLAVKGILVVAIYLPLFIVFGASREDRQLLVSLIPQGARAQVR